MTQEIKVVYKDSDKSVVDFINLAGGLDTSVTIEPVLEANGSKVAPQVLTFADDVTLTNDMVTVSASGVASKV
tara:strand:- start:272 stop:490 length:219 start_codon:yes stop_codon:yes gene_type:complete